MNRLLVTTSVLLLAAGAEAQDLDEVMKQDEAKARKENACITMRSYSQMRLQAMGDNFMFVQSASDSYLLSFRRKCPGLSEGYNIRFEKEKRRICSNNRARVTFEAQGFITMPSCTVRMIEEVEDWQHAAAIVNERESKKRADKAEKREKKKREKAEKKRK